MWCANNRCIHFKIRLKSTVLLYPLGRCEKECSTYFLVTYLDMFPFPLMYYYQLGTGIYTQLVHCVTPSFLEPTVAVVSMENTQPAIPDFLNLTFTVDFTSVFKHRSCLDRPAILIMSECYSLWQVSFFKYAPERMTPSMKWSDFLKDSPWTPIFPWSSSTFRLNSVQDCWLTW